MGQNIIFNEEEQIRTILINYPDFKDSFNIRIDIYGLILDHISRTKESLVDIIITNQKLEEYLFKIDTDKGNKEKPFHFLKELYPTYEELFNLRQAAEKNSWNNMLNYINRIDKDASKIGLPSTESLLDKIAGHKVAGVIWQLSDIHFGKLNELGLSPIQIAKNLNLVADHEKQIFHPRLILISGDITTQASEDEFNEFGEFSNYLSNELWGSPSLHRILVVPGNHDVTWHVNGVADKLKSFQRHIVSENGVTTPFGFAKIKKKDNLGEITINTFSDDEYSDFPPFALVTEKKLKLQILLLVSSYYSGLVPERIRKIMKKIEDLPAKETLKNLCREDTGELSMDYLLHIKKNLYETDKTTISLSHHNLESYGKRPCKVPRVHDFLKTLYSKNIFLAFHGHTHLLESNDSGRVPNLTEAFPIPCPTLCSDREPNSKYGFFIHLIGPANDERKITTLCLEINDSKFFNPSPNTLKPIYQFTVNNREKKLSVNFFKQTHCI